MQLTEDDIRPRDLMEAKNELLEADKEYLRRRKSEFVMVPCPACGIEDCDAWGAKDGFRYVRCVSCATVYMRPRASIGLMEEFYRQSKNYSFWNEHIYPATEKTRRESIIKPRVARLIQYCRQFGLSGGRLLEVGAAFGTFCQCVEETGIFSEVIALEPTPELAMSCRKRGLHVIESSIEKLSLPADSVNVVAAFEVIEHLFAPGQFIGDCMRYLAPGGLLILTCPNIDSIHTRLFGDRATGIDHEHVNYFTPESLSLLIEKSGLHVLDVATPGEMDVDLLRNSLAQGLKCDGEALLKVLLERSDDQTTALLQEIIKRTRLSSHMWMVAQKLAQ